MPVTLSDILQYYILYQYLMFNSLARRTIDELLTCDEISVINARILMASFKGNYNFKEKCRNNLRPATIWLYKNITLRYQIWAVFFFTQSPISYDIHIFL